MDPTKNRQVLKNFDARFSEKAKISASRSLAGRGGQASTGEELATLVNFQRKFADLASTGEEVSIQRAAL